MDEDHLYFVSSDQTKVTSVRIKDLTSETLFEGNEISLAPKVGNGLLYSQDNIHDGTFYYYDLSNKKPVTVQRPKGEAQPLLTYGDWIITTAELEDGQYQNVGIKIEEYLDGKSEYSFMNTLSNAKD